LDLYNTYLNAQFAGSYKVILQIGKYDENTTLQLFGDEYQIEENLIDSIIDNIGLVNQGSINEITAQYSNTEKNYLDFFLSSVKNFAPDGEKIKTIGLTVVRNGQEKRTVFDRKKTEIKLSSPSIAKNGQDIKPESDQDLAVTIEGILDFAKSRKNKKYIEISNENGKSTRFKISEGKLAAIVRENYEERVRVTGIRGKKTRGKEIFEFVDIESVDEN
jgi:hypothetical protein